MNTDVLQEDKSSIFNDVIDLLEKENYNKAITILQEHLQESPDDIAGLHLLGIAYAKQNDYINAERIFKNVLKSDANRVDAYFNLGLIHSQQNRLSEAKDDFENVIRLNPDDAQALNDLGVINHTLGDEKTSQEYFSKSLKAKPTFNDAFLNLFELFWNKGKYNLALEYAYNFLKELGPKNTKQSVDEEKADHQPDQKPDTARTIEFRKTVPEINADEPAVLFTNTEVITKSEKLELFNQHVPEMLRDKKTGMNIAFVADLDIAGQLDGLFRLINEKTIHRARYITYQDNHILYDKDIVLSLNNQGDRGTARKIIENADFFHIGRFPKDFDDLKILEYLRPDNTIVQYYDNDFADRAVDIYTWHQVKMIFGLAICDYTMLEQSPFFYHINLMFDCSKVKPAPKPEGTIKIVHRTTDRKCKDTELFVNAIEKLRKNHDVEPVVIEGKSHEECLEIISQSHMTYDQITTGIYGISAIESLAAGHVVFSGISNFAASVYPDNPIVRVDENDLDRKIEYFLTNRAEVLERGSAGKAWVKSHHNPLTILKQYLYMYDLVKNGHRILTEPDKQILR